MRAEDIIQAAMVGQRIEQIPKNFDFGPQVRRQNQVMSFEAVNGFVEQRTSQLPEDAMMVTGLRMTSNTQNGGNNNFAAAPFVVQEQSVNPSELYSGEPPRNSLGGASHIGSNSFMQPGSIKSNGSGLKSKSAFRAGSNDRKSSIGADSNG